MTVQTVKLAGERYVLIRERDFRALKEKSRTSKTRKTRGPSVQERGDIAEAKRRKPEPSVTVADVRKRLGL